jgi:hypothetical protein
MLRRYVREGATSPDEIDRMPFADLVRTGNAQGLLRRDWPIWAAVSRDARPHEPYLRCQVASQVASAIPGFLEEAEHFYAELQRRLA